jgi:alkanesulfonate monooxygenase SsuD/methylene tetrahydromethanopterin reductase-like flavin-dependent oxidoreductase (luciferase family)
MKFGLFGGPRTEGYSAYVDAVVEAEALGFHSNFLVEHHFTGIGQVSASMNLLAFIAARTRTIRLGTAVVVLPWHNPILVAEQAATLDRLSGGRFDFGVGKGYRPGEFDGFCIPIAEAAERFEEAMTVIRTAWTANGRFSHHGKRWRYENIVVEPSPLQKPHPPLWLAAGRPDSLAYAAREGYRLFLDQLQTVEVIVERLDIFKRALAAAGRAWDPMGVAVARGLIIARNAAEREQAVAARMQALETLNAFGSRQSSMASDTDLRKAAEDGTLIGTPDEIARRLELLRAQGVNYVLLATSHPPTLRAFAKEIMPAFA